MELRGKTCIVTGSAQGLGKEFSTRLLQAGALVTISDMNKEIGEKSVVEFRRKFGKNCVHFVACDVTRGDQLENLLNESEKFFQAPVDIFVNNAGIYTQLGWKVCMEVNIMAVMMATRLAMDRMRGRNGCRIVNISSMSGIMTGWSEDSAPYFVSKHGVVALSRTLAANRAEHGVHVTCLCPSFADTSLARNIIDKSNDRIQGIVKKRGVMTLERVGEAFEALMASKNGTVIAVMPEIMELPDISRHQMQAMVTVARLLHLFGVKVLRPRHILGAALVLMVLVQLLIRILI